MDSSRAFISCIIVGWFTADSCWCTLWIGICFGLISLIKYVFTMGSIVAFWVSWLRTTKDFLSSITLVGLVLLFSISLLSVFIFCTLVLPSVGKFVILIELDFFISCALLSIGLTWCLILLLLVICCFSRFRLCIDFLMIAAGISSWLELVDEVEEVNEDGDDVESDVAEYWNSWNERLSVSFWSIQ